ncbi:MAG: decaprenylphospho-beta-D-ribofuranose 2-oxidase [Actinomycetota bacterium]|jgi:decaprenylphospho-beta-D-ribofuranose 2-oxidase|nr:decaprenylphospho-beta-D-ribofuranose 2-oxidase [Actinomycetota bacterium]
MAAETRRLLSGWGRTAPTAAKVVEPIDDHEVEWRVGGGADRRGVIARGLGRSYNDAAQNAGGLVLDLTRLRTIEHFDADTGVVDASSSISVEDLLQLFLPRGWFPPVTPGTRFVTLGGSVAADVHGKNHHHDGSFMDHVRSLRMTTPADGTTKVEAGDDLFWATAGGMGLTGVVNQVKLQLRRVETAWMRVDTERATDLDDVLGRMEEGDAKYEYSVAWIDCLARGPRLGRAVLTRGQHATAAELPPLERNEPFTLPPTIELAAPPWVPAGLLNKATVRTFNELWFRRAPKHERERIVAYPSFFYPLDGVEGWNRLYGKRGFVQYQAVVPLAATGTLRSMIERLGREGTASFLSVLKRFGPGNRGMLSFPTEGWTLALDIPVSGHDLRPMLDQLDRMVVDAGGRVYVAKDSRVDPGLLRAMYPRLDEWKAVQATADPDGVMQSDLGRRLGLVRR